MPQIAKLVLKVVLIVTMGGLLGATLVRIAPGFGVDEQELDTRLSNESVRALRNRRSADNNVSSFYYHYVRDLLHGNLGTSRTFSMPVSTLLAQRYPETAESLGLGLAFAWTLGLTLAIASVMSRSAALDLISSALTGILLCVPAAVLALVFVLARAPTRLLVGLIVLPKIFRYSRNLLARAAASPHVLTARAKGVSESRVLLWHILPGALPQIAALGGVSVSLGFTAAIPIEALCDLPGIGQLAWKAAMGRDMALLVSLTMVVTLVTTLANGFSELMQPYPERVR